MMSRFPLAVSLGVAVIVAGGVPSAMDQNTWTGSGTSGLWSEHGGDAFFSGNHRHRQHQ